MFYEIPRSVSYSDFSQPYSVKHLSLKYCKDPSERKENKCLYEGRSTFL